MIWPLLQRVCRIHVLCLASARHIECSSYVTSGPLFDMLIAGLGHDFLSLLRVPMCRIFRKELPLAKGSWKVRGLVGRSSAKACDPGACDR